MHRSGKEGLLKEIGRWGLGKRDLHANVNFFSKVTADEDGNLSLPARHQPGGRLRRPALRHGRAGGAIGQRLIRSICARTYVAEAGQAHRLAQPALRRPTTIAATSAPRTSAASSIPSATSRNRKESRCSLQSKLDPKTAVVDEICPAGEPWMKPIRKGQVLRILDLEGNQAVDTLFYNAARSRRSATAQSTPSSASATSISTTGTQADFHRRQRRC